MAAHIYEKCTTQEGKVFGCHNREYLFNYNNWVQVLWKIEGGGRKDFFIGKHVKPISKPCKTNLEAKLVFRGGKRAYILQTFIFHYHILLLMHNYNPIIQWTHYKNKQKKSAEMRYKFIYLLSILCIPRPFFLILKHPIIKPMSFLNYLFLYNQI